MKTDYIQRNSTRRAQRDAAKMMALAEAIVAIAVEYAKVMVRLESIAREIPPEIAKNIAEKNGEDPARFSVWAASLR